MTALPERGDSLRARLLRRLLLPLLLVLLLDASLGYVLLLRPIEDAHDEGLTDSATALAQHLAADPAAPSGLRFDLSAQGEEMLRSDRLDEVFFLILGPGETFVAGDRLLPAPPPGSGGMRYYDGVRNGTKVRAVALHTRRGDLPVTVIVAETTRKRAAAAWEVALGVGLPQLALAGIVLAVVWFGVRGGLASLEGLRREIEARAPKDMGPLDPTDVVSEVRPLVKAFDSLLGRLDAAAAAQRRFLANAAHQLRTPLAGLKSQLDLAIEEQDPQARHARLLRIREATDRTTRLVNQLLALSAAEPDVRRAGAWRAGDLKDILAGQAQGWYERAVAAGVDLGLELQPAALMCDELLIGELATNLVDNALAYGRRAGRVTIRCGTEGGAAFLEVEDDGPGIPQAERARVTERFYRLPGSPGIGSGLGLAIVGEIVRNHGGCLTFADAPRGGLVVRVVLPGTPASPSRQTSSEAGAASAAVSRAAVGRPAA